MEQMIKLQISSHTLSKQAERLKCGLVTLAILHDEIESTMASSKEKTTKPVLDEYMDALRVITMFCTRDTIKELFGDDCVVQFIKHVNERMI